MCALTCSPTMSKNRLGNFAPLTRPQDSFIRGFRRSAFGLAWGPRTSVEVRPPPLGVHTGRIRRRVSIAAGPTPRGTASPLRFSKVRSADFGFRFDWGDPLRLTTGAFYTHLSDDIAFDAADGRLERIGATRRVGAAAHVVSRPLHWWVESLSITFVDAILLEPPPPSAEEPQPPFVEGQNLPFVPPVVIRVDQGLRHTFLENVGGSPSAVERGSAFRTCRRGRCPHGDFADPVALLDASAGLSWGPVDLDFEVFNALNSRYAAVDTTPSPPTGIRTMAFARARPLGTPAAGGPPFRGCCCWGSRYELALLPRSSRGSRSWLRRDGTGPDQRSTSRCGDGCSRASPCDFQRAPSPSTGPTLRSDRSTFVPAQPPETSAKRLASNGSRRSSSIRQPQSRRLRANFQASPGRFALGCTTWGLARS